VEGEEIVMKKVWKTILSILTLVSVLAAVAACFAAEADEKGYVPPLEGDKKEMLIGVSLATKDGAFWQCIEDYIKIAAGEYENLYGIKINTEFTVANMDASKQATDIQDLIAKKPDVIIISPQDSSAILASVKACHDAGIPVIATARQVSPDAKGDQIPECYIGLDTTDQAYTAGKAMFEKMLADGIKEFKCIEVIGDLADENAVNRSNGFEKAADEFKAEIVQTVNCEWNYDKTLSLTSAALVAHPETNCIFLPSDAHSASLQSALERNKKYFKTGEAGHVYVSTQDASPDGLAQLRAGYWDTDTSYDHWPCSVENINVAVMLANGRPAPKPIMMISGRVVTPENVDTLQNLWGND
jgi:ribose transport system substrate-binding protein